jgi:hypothetical protein
VTLDRPTATSAEQVTRDEHEVTEDAERQFRPRRPNASAVAAQEPTGSGTPERIEPDPVAGAAAETVSPLDELLESVGPAPVGRRRDALAVGLAIATFLALVGAVLWVGSGLASRDASPAGGTGSRLPARPTAGDAPGSPAASAPVTTAPSASVPVTSQPATAAAPTRTRTTAPAARTVRVTVSVVDDGGGRFQLAIVVDNITSATQTWELVITFPVRVERLQAVGTGTLTARGNQAIVRGTSGPGESGIAIGGVTSDGSTLRTWTCTVNGLSC